MITLLETFRLLEALAGVAAFGVMTFRLVGRWPVLSDVSKWVVALLGIANATIGLTAARAALLDSPFNEIGLVGVIVNFATITVGLLWWRLIPSGNRDTDNPALGGSHANRS